MNLAFLGIGLFAIGSLIWIMGIGMVTIPNGVERFQALSIAVLSYFIIIIFTYIITIRRSKKNEKN